MDRGIYVLLTIILLALPCRAEHFRIAIASEDDLYIGDILKFALDSQGGGHTMEVVRGVEIAQQRALRALEVGRAPYDVIYSGYSSDRADQLVMVEFPLTRGMLGYRVLAIREDRQGKLSADIGFERLQKEFCFGAGTDWPDTEIMRQAGLCVVTAGDKGLWPMLARGRYDAFPRGLIEVVSEMKREAHKYEDGALALDAAVMLAYQQDLFFFLPKSEAAKAAIIQEGLEKGHADGSYDRFFYRIPVINQALDEIQRHQRVTFHLGNPPQSAALAKIPEEYWYHFDDASAFAGNRAQKKPAVGQ